jgi:hypothetical protein
MKALLIISALVLIASFAAFASFKITRMNRDLDDKEED